MPARMSMTQLGRSADTSFEEIEGLSCRMVVWPERRLMED